MTIWIAIKNIILNEITQRKNNTIQVHLDVASEKHYKPEKTNRTNINTQKPTITKQKQTHRNRE